MIIAGALVTGTGEEIRGFDPASNAAVEPGYRYGDAGHVDSACAAAAEAFPGFRATTSEQRALFLEAIAANLEAIKAPLVARAVLESGLPEGRIAGEVGRTTGQLRLFAERVAGGQLDGRADRPGAARPDPVAPARHPPARGAAGPGGRIRCQQLPARVLGGGRRHRVCSGRRLPGGGQGARRTPWHVRTGGPRHRRRSGIRRSARWHVLAAVRSWPRTRRCARQGSAHQGRRVHRVPVRRNRSGRRGSDPPRADPGLRGDELDQPGLPPRRSPVDTGRRPRPRVRRIVDDGVGPVLHESRSGHRRRRSRPRRLHLVGTRCADRGRRHPDAHSGDRQRTTPTV